LCVLIFGASKSFVNVSNSFTADSCYRFAGRNGADHYALYCVRDEDISDGPAYAANQPPHPDADSCWTSPGGSQAGLR
jgi:hypothetical protein